MIALSIFLVLITAICWIAALLAKERKKHERLPPGLPWYPLVGSTLLLQPNMFEVFRKVTPRFKANKMFTVYMGNTPLIVITDYAVFKEAMAMEELSHRPTLGANDDFFYPDETGNRRGIMFSNGDNWREQRRFTLRHLRDLGFGKVTMEHLILDEAYKCAQMLGEGPAAKGEPVSLRLKLNIAILNALWNLLTGQKMGYDDPKCQELVRKFNTLMSTSSPSGLQLLFPWLKYVVPSLIGYTNNMEANRDLVEILQRAYQQHLDNFDPDNIKDFMDAYIQQQLLANDQSAADVRQKLPAGRGAPWTPGSSFQGDAGFKNFYAIMINLFVAGSETTSNTLSFALWYLSRNPGIQERLHREIDSAFGKVGCGDCITPSLTERARGATPLLEAVVAETMRCMGLAYVGIPRILTDDIVLGDYTLPKGCHVVPAIHEIMNDPESFENPGKFDPDRFLEADQTGGPATSRFRSHEKLVAFGGGKRVCPGKALAIDELYLFLTVFLQRFDFRLPAPLHSHPEHLVPKVGFVLTCPDYQLIISHRA